ncbi:MAG: CaiB/BaiF CoA-transferase family protein [Cyclobacteriaceae bacterium]
MGQLRDIKILELASVLAGPGVGQFFAELGAEVIKVENLKTAGDVTRSWKSPTEKTDDRSAYFCAVNWGKQSIALDLATEEGREIVYKLALSCDIVIASYKPGDAEKLGVDYTRLSKNHPGLIYGQITGYGSHNPRVGYDAIIQAEAGFMSMNGEPGGKSLKMPVALMDILAGHQLKEGLLLALLEKVHTGKGKLVEVSLLQAAIASLANQATNFLLTQKLPQKQGSAHPNIAPYGDVFFTADGKEILLAVGTDYQFGQLLNILNIGEISKDFRFKTNVLRVQNRASLNDHIAHAISGFQAVDLMASLNKSLVPAGLIRNVEEVLSEREALPLLLSSGGLEGLKTYVANPDENDNAHFLPPPRLGEHTVSILKRLLNLSANDIQSLFSKGIIV